MHNCVYHAKRIYWQWSETREKWLKLQYDLMRQSNTTVYGLVRKRGK